MGEPVTAGRPATVAMTPAMTPAFARWCRTGYGPNASDNLIAQAWQIATSDYREFWQSVDATEGERDQLQAAHNALSRKNAELAAELAEARTLLADLSERLARAALNRDRLSALADETGEERDRFLAALEEIRELPLRSPVAPAIARQALEG